MMSRRMSSNSSTNVSSNRSARATIWSPRWLDACSLLCVFGALAFALLPTMQHPHPIVPALSSPPSARTPLPADSSGAQIVARNLFSATRRAPSVRFSPPGSEEETPQTTSAATAMATGAGSDDGPRLFGIISQNGERRALLQLPGTDSTPYLVSAGDRRGGYRIVSIAPDRVVVVSSAGTRTVRLALRAPSDSSENH